MISSAVQPLLRWAPRFQLAIRPLGVEHEDRVVPHRVDHQPEPLLALAQLELGEPLRGHVLALGEQVERLAGPVAHRRSAWCAGRPRPTCGCSRVTTSAPFSTMAVVASDQRRRRRPPPRRTRARGARRARRPEDRGQSAALARTMLPCSVIVAMPIAASSKTLWNRSTCSSSTGLDRLAGSAGSRSGRRLAGRPVRGLSSAHQLRHDVVERGGLGEVRRRARARARAAPAAPRRTR